jgi:hypothetical protein
LQRAALKRIAAGETFAVHFIQIAIAGDDNAGGPIAELVRVSKPGMIAAADKVLAWSMICVPSTPLELASPLGIASLAEFISRCTELKARRSGTRSARLHSCARVLVSTQRTPVTRRVAGS